MKKVILAALSVIFVIILSSCDKGQSNKAYYVGNNNKEHTDGSKLNPWGSFCDVDYSLLKAGDTICLMSDGLFKSIAIDSLTVGTKEKPIIITSSASGKAKVASGDSVGMHIRNSKNLKIERLHLIGSGRKDGNTKDGLLVYECEGIYVSEIEAEGYQKSGLHISSSSNVIADGINAHDNGFAGIFVSGKADRKDASQNIVIRNSKADNNPGDPTNLTNHSGNGILVGNCSNVTIEYCTATNNGWDMPRVGNGPVGIWAYEADNVLIQYCIAYRNKTQKGAADGGGFDLDGGVTNSIIQYCLSYENEGSGYGLFQYNNASPWYNNTVRYCISENDGLVSASRSGVFVWNATGDSTLLKDCYFYNNTIYNEKGAAISYEANSAHQNFYFYNNIFVAENDLITGKEHNSTFLANNWYSLSSGGFKMENVNSLENWAKQYQKEYQDGKLVGQNISPEFRNAGKTNLTDPKQLSSYDAYFLPDNSPLRTNGLNLSELLGIDTGGKDFNQKNVGPTIVGACQ